MRRGDCLGRMGGGSQSVILQLGRWGSDVYTLHYIPPGQGVQI